MRWIKEEIHDTTDPQEIQNLRQNLYTHIKHIRKLHHKSRIRTLIVANKRDIKIFYIRYADDWILLTTGTKEIAEFIKTKITKFLEEKLCLKLSQEKTIITEISKERAHFLGFELGISPRGKLQRVPTNNKKFRKYNLRRYTGGPVWTAPDRQRLINRLFMKGFCTRTGFPKEMPWLSCIEPQVIIQRYNAVLLNFYIGHVRNRASLHRWIYIIRYSYLKTFAQKYKFLEEFFQLEFEKYLLFL